MESNESIKLSASAGRLAKWFAEGVRSEIKVLEKEGSIQKYEVLSGEIIERISDEEVNFQFIIADSTRIPEDSKGQLRTDNTVYEATVIGQQANRLYVNLTGDSPIPDGIPRVTLTIDDTALLKSLAEALEEIESDPAKIGSLATTVFHPHQVQGKVTNLPDTPAFSEIDNDLKAVLEQACGSEVTYVWGPPGTGKTYAIAYLITALLEKGERVLVSSHTHAAVDQALYAAVKTEPNNHGPLANHPLVQDEKILRIGYTKDRKVPDGVKLTKVVEKRANELEEQILELEEKANSLLEKVAQNRKGLSEWKSLDRVKERLTDAHLEVEKHVYEQRKAEDTINDCSELLQQRQEALDKAQRAWFGRKKKVERATTALQITKKELQKSTEALLKAKEDTTAAMRRVEETKDKVIQQQKICEEFRPKADLEHEINQFTSKLKQIEGEIGELQNEISELETRLINEARAIFCTLTKSYVGKELEGQAFDAVIVDEISMALPPLIFLASGRARKRVILVGDFLQLPPIVRSGNRETELSDLIKERLGNDTFHLAGIERDLKPVKNCKVLTRLVQQRRMMPEIAAVARHLVYNKACGGDYDQTGCFENHPSVLEKPTPDWLNFLPESPLVIIDTADLHSWSGKQPGSLSRFNFYSATMAVELAAMAALDIPKPHLDDAPPIGIVTPYAAQRRLLTKMIKGMGLEQWVAAGTVHTFQGGEADLIIFDLVLDEPHWSARLNIPRFTDEVIKDLNVAVTRAESKFVFLASSEWLNKCAKKANSALGHLWAYLREHAPLVAANEVIEQGFIQRVSDKTLHELGWNIQEKTGKENYAILDEHSFYDYFVKDINSCSESLFGLVPYFGEYRWPHIEPHIHAALERGVEVTLVVQPLEDAKNPSYVKKIVKQLQDLGAVVITATGLHGKDIVIDNKIHYTGSLNWASHRGRMEIMHRRVNQELAEVVLTFLQARNIRTAAINEDGTPRTCPQCGGPTILRNQLSQHGIWWDRQALKVGCARYKETGCKYLRPIDERPPFKEIPVCEKDGVTKYRLIEVGRKRKKKKWQCPKHPKEEIIDFVDGDPEPWEMLKQGEIGF